MEPFALALLFASLTLLFTRAGTRVWTGPMPVTAEPAVEAPALSRKLGGALPPSPKNADMMRRMLLGAGYWRRETLPRVYFLKAALALLFASAGSLVMRQLALATEGKLLLIEVALAAGFLLPNGVLRYRGLLRRRRLRLGLPNALDLVVMCLDAGLAIDAAIVETARGLEHTFPELAQELALVNLEIRAGVDRAQAIRNLPLRTGTREMKDLALVLLHADRVRVSAGESLRSHAGHMRAMQARVLAARAGMLGVKLTFPLFFCTLPAALLVLVGPEVVQYWRRLAPVLRMLEAGF